ncbi:hypothetical protein EJB05_01331, partial [Eragrostis curvula]
MSRRIPSGHACVYSVATFRFGSSAAVIEATVTRDAAVADAWVRALRASHPRGARLLLGLDCKWRQTTKQQPPDEEDDDEDGRRRRSWAAAAVPSRAAVLLLCAGGGSCLVLQLLYARRVPECLRRLLGDPAVRLVGVGVGEGAARLAADHGLVCAAAVDLAGPCGAYLGLEGAGGGDDELGLKDYAKEILGLNMERPDTVAMSDWEKRDLDVAQVRYACVDAYVAYRLGERVLGD